MARGRPEAFTSVFAGLLVVIIGFFLAAYTVSALNIPLSFTTTPISTTINEILQNPDAYYGLTVSTEGYLTTVCPENQIGCAVYITDDQGNMIETHGPSPAELPIGEYVTVVGQVSLDQKLEKVILHVQSVYQHGQLVYKRSPGDREQATIITVTTTKTITVTLGGTTTTKEITPPTGSSIHKTNLVADIPRLLTSPTFLILWIAYSIVGIAIVSILSED